MTRERTARAKPGDFNALTDTLTDRHRKLILSRQVRIRRWIRHHFEYGSFNFVCNMSMSSRTKGGVARNYMMMFGRAALSHGGRILLKEDAWAEIERGLSYGPLVIYPHISMPTTMWTQLSGGSTSSYYRFWRMNAEIHGVLRPSVVDTSIIPAFNQQATTDDKILEWANIVGGLPSHHVHPIPISLSIDSDSVIVAQGVEEATVVNIGVVEGGADPFRFSFDGDMPWIRINEATGKITIKPPIDTPVVGIVASFTATDYLGAQETVLLEITVVPAPPAEEEDDESS